MSAWIVEKGHIDVLVAVRQGKPDPAPTGNLT